MNSVSIFIKKKKEPSLLVRPWKVSAQNSDSNHRDYRENNWHNLALEIHKTARNGALEQCQIILALLGDHLISPIHEEFVRGLIFEAQDYGWGSEVFLAVKAFNRNVHREYSGLNRWFKHVTGNSIDQYKLKTTSIDDLLELDEQTFDCTYGDLDIKTLDEFHLQLSRSEERLLVLRELRRRQAWKVHPIRLDYCSRWILNKETILNECFNSSDDIGIAGIIPVNERTRPQRKIDLFLAYKGLGQKPSKWLLEERNNNRFASFNSIFEIRFFIEHLNQHVISTNTLSLSNILREVTPVQLSQKPVFAKPTNTSSGLLLSSSFNRDIDGTSYVVSASREVANIRRQVGPGFTFPVYPSLNPEDLGNIANELRHELSAWVFIGHGFPGGLVTESQDLVWAEKWLNHWRFYGRGLSLALFSACESSKTAKSFAEVGVRFTIGFEKKVTHQQCWIMTREVVPAALSSKGDVRKIEDAFHRACAQLSSLATPQSNYPEPVAYVCEQYR
jgi:hypothetical protein